VAAHWHSFQRALSKLHTVGIRASERGQIASPQTVQLYAFNACPESSESRIPPVVFMCCNTLASNSRSQLATIDSTCDGRAPKLAMSIQYERPRRHQTRGLYPMARRSLDSGWPRHFDKCSMRSQTIPVRALAPPLTWTQPPSTMEQFTCRLQTISTPPQ
jgi:hypothetical protein